MRRCKAWLDNRHSRQPRTNARRWRARAIGTEPTGRERCRGRWPAGPARASPRRTACAKTRRGCGATRPARVVEEPGERNRLLKLLEIANRKRHPERLGYRVNLEPERRSRMIAPAEKLLSWQRFVTWPTEAACARHSEPAPLRAPDGRGSLALLSRTARSAAGFPARPTCPGRPVALRHNRPPLGAAQAGAA
jgi:hypothetical protein